MLRTTAFFLAILVTSFSGVKSQNIYEKGLEAHQKGDIITALEIWDDILDVKSPEEYDPRAGFAYIELVTEREMKEYYRQANEMYFWSMNGLSMSEYQEEYRAELERLSPLLSPKEYREYKRNIDDLDNDFFNEITSMWNRLDPTPVTPYNERLLEHWERLNEAEDRYAVTTGYDLEELLQKDSRAETLVKFGEPDRLRKGVLSYNIASVKRWIRERMSSAGASATVNNGEASIQNQLENQMEDQIRAYHSPQNYEVWIYQNPSYYSDKAVYIFGSENAGRTYKARRSVDDFIPQAAFSMGQRNKVAIDLTTNESTVAGLEGDGDGLAAGSSITPGQGPGNYGDNITPAVIMQLMYYEQMLAVDEIFANAYDNIVNDYIDITNPLSISLASRTKNQNIGAVARLQSSMPEQKSKILNKVTEINVEAYPYRFLDKYNQPYTIFFVQSDAYKAFSTDYFKNEYYKESTEKLKNYVYQHELRVFDPDWYPKTSMTYKPLLDVDFGQQKADAGSVFILPYTSEEDNVVLAASLYNQDPEAESPVKNTPFDDELRGLGKTITNSPFPLESEGFMLSDIVLGYKKLDNPDLQFPFVINNRNRIPIGENLVFYFEVYNLSRQASGNAKFILELNLSKKRKGLYRLFGGNNESVGLTLNFESAESLFGEVIEMQTSNLNAGRYVLEILATESNTNETIKREIEINVVEPEVKN